MFNRFLMEIYANAFCEHIQMIIIDSRAFVRSIANVFEWLTVCVCVFESASPKCLLGSNFWNDKNFWFKSMKTAKCAPSTIGKFAANSKTTEFWLVCTSIHRLWHTKNLLAYWNAWCHFTESFCKNNKQKEFRKKVCLNHRLMEVHHFVYKMLNLFF